MVDEQTFVREVEAMERTLYRISRSYLYRWEDCADAVQEALGKAWAKRAAVEEAWFRAWLVRIVINECHNVLRHRKRVMPVAEVEERAAADEDLMWREAVLALPERLRLPILLHYLEGFELKEVARILHLPLGTVKSRMHQARKVLKQEWNEEEWL